MDHQIETAAPMNAPHSAATDEDVLPTLLRYRDKHLWSWNLSMRLINMQFGTQCTEKQLKALYKKHRQ